MASVLDEMADLGLASELHLFSHLVLVAPPAIDQCYWGILAESGCAPTWRTGNGPCLMIVKDCATANQYLRSWGINQAFLRLDRFWSDRGPLAFSGDRLATWDDSLCGGARQCNYVASQLLRMDYVPEWRIRVIRQSSDGKPAIYRIPLASLDQNAHALPLSWPQLIIVVHPVTEALYIVSVRNRVISRDPGLNPVVIHSISRVGTSLLLSDLSFEGPAFTDLGSIFSISQVSPLAMDGSCVISVVFGCFSSPPDWNLLATPLGYIGSTPVYERSVLRFRVTSSSSGTCLPSKVDLSLSSSVYSAAVFRVEQATSGKTGGNVSLSLNAGQSCVAETFLYRQGSSLSSPPGLATEVQISASTQDGQSQSRTVMIGDVGRGCWPMGSFEVAKLELLPVAAGLELRVQVSSRRPKYCPGAEDVVLQVSCACNQSSTLSDVSGFAATSLVLGCCESGEMMVTLSRKFQAGQMFVRMAMLKNLANCSRERSNEKPPFDLVVTPVLNGEYSSAALANFSSNLTVFQPQTFAFVIEVQPTSRCNVQAWQSILLQQLTGAPNQMPPYPNDTADIPSASSASVDYSWTIGHVFTPLRGVAIHLDDRVTLRPDVSTMFMLRASVQLEDFAEAPHSFSVEFVLEQQTSQEERGRAVAWSTCTFKKTFVESDGSCVRVPPRIWAWCSDQVSTGTLNCMIQVMSMDLGQCPFTRYIVEVKNMDNTVDVSFSIKDATIPSSEEVVNRNVSVTLPPQSTRSWSVTAKLQTPNLSIWQGFSATVSSSFHPAQNDLTEVVHLRGCENKPLEINGLQSLYVSSLRKTFVLKGSIVNHAEYPCLTASVQMHLETEDPLVLFNATGPEFVSLHKGQGDFEFRISVWKASASSSRSIKFKLSVVDQTSKAFQLQLVADACVPGPAVVQLTPCSQNEYDPESSGETRFCGMLQSGDQGQCEEPVLFNATLEWDVSNPDSNSLYSSSREVWNTHFILKHGGKNLSFWLSAGETRHFNFTIAHSKGVRPGSYDHVLVFRQWSGHLARNSVAPPIVAPIHITCPRPGVVSLVRVDQFTPLFQPTVTVVLRWIRPCDELCCRGMRFSVFRNGAEVGRDLVNAEFFDTMQSKGARNVYRIESRDTMGRKSPGPGEACDVTFEVVVEQHASDLISFFLLLGGLLVFSALLVLIIVLVHKTRKIDLEINRLQKVGEMHELSMIESVADVDEPLPRTPVRGGGREDDEGTMVIALEDNYGSGPDELPFAKGDIIRVIRRNARTGWWRGEIGGVSGVFNEQLVRVLPHSLPNTPATNEKKRWGDDMQ